MKDIFAISIMCFLLISSIGCGLRDDHFKEYNEFAIKSAKMGLWNEAIMRWKRMAELYPNDARVHNNLAVAYESKGELDLAMSEYEKAVKLAPKDHVYLKNYNKFMQNYKKTQKKTEEDKPNEEPKEKI